MEDLQERAESCAEQREGVDCVAPWGAAGGHLEVL